MEIRVLNAHEARTQVEALADVLLDCVEGGASVSFMAGFSKTDSVAFFEKVAAGVGRGERILLAALEDSRVVGTVQVLLAMPPNQPHRAEIAKLLVVREARGRGVGRRLMEQAEMAARKAGKSLLLLDTADSHAEKLYASLGWTRLGVVPDFALLPDGRFCDTTFFFKKLLVS
jgi:GNAT superfamily N-acetyltransferase